MMLTSLDAHDAYLVGCAATGVDVHGYADAS